MALSQAKDLDDLKTCDDTSSLWKHNMDPFIRVTDDKMKLVGSYLFCYDKWGRFIRSGKVYGTKVDYGTRYKQHMQSARLQDADDQRSKFYCTFNMFIGTGFDKHNCSLLVKDVSDGGIFQWTKEAIQLARTCHGNSCKEKGVREDYPRSTPWPAGCRSGSRPQTTCQTSGQIPTPLRSHR